MPAKKCFDIVSFDARRSQRAIPSGIRGGHTCRRLDDHQGGGGDDVEGVGRRPAELDWDARRRSRNRMSADCAPSLAIRLGLIPLSLLRDFVEQALGPAQGVKGRRKRVSAMLRFHLSGQNKERVVVLLREGGDGPRELAVREADGARPLCRKGLAKAVQARRDIPRSTPSCRRRSFQDWKSALSLSLVTGLATTFLNDDMS